MYATGVGVGPGITETTATSHGLALARVAIGCGIPVAQVVEVEARQALADALERAARETGPWVIVAQVDPLEPVPRPNRRPEVDIVESANNLKRAMVERGYGRRPGT